MSSIRSLWYRLSRPAAWLLGVVLLAAVNTAAWAVYPDRPIRIVVAWPPGAPTDTATRIIAEKLSQRLGQPVLVENKAGASGTIGSLAVANSPADGYTLQMATADSHSIAPHVRKLPYDGLKSFTPITLVARNAFVLVARPTLEFKDLDRFVAAAKQAPEKYSYGTWGVGSSAHIAVALFENAAGIKLLHVPFQGAAPAITALMGSQIDLLVLGPETAARNRSAGKMNVLAVASAERVTPWLPDVKTFAEYGFNGADSGSWFGIVAPAGLPGAIQTQLSGELVAILKMPEVAQKLEAMGWKIEAGSPSELEAFMQAQYERFGKIVRDRAIHAE